MCVWWWLRARSCCTSLFRTPSVLQVIPTAPPPKYNSVVCSFVVVLSIYLTAASVSLQLIWCDPIWTRLHWSRLKNVRSVGGCFIPSTFIHLWSIRAFNLLQFAMLECVYFNLKWLQITWASWKSSSKRTVVPFVGRIKNDYGGKGPKCKHLCV